MRLNLKVAIYMALFTGLFTLLLAILYDISRITTILYRVGVTVVLFGVLGYILGGWLESYWQKLIAEGFHKGQKVDITDQPDPGISLNEDLASQTETTSEFKPLTPDDFASISSEQK